MTITPDDRNLIEQRLLAGLAAHTPELDSPSRWGCSCGAIANVKVDAAHKHLAAALADAVIDPDAISFVTSRHW